MFEKFKLEILLGLVGLFLIGLGFFLIKSSDVSSESVEIVDEVVHEEGESGVDLVVNISGAVVSPGMYSIEAGSRLGQVIDKAGGLSVEADTEWVEKNVNLAEKIKDGQKIYVPKISSHVEKDTLSQDNERVNINSASRSDLEELNGVGPATSTKIVENRPYARIEELVEKKILSEKVFEGIKDKLVLW